MLKKSFTLVLTLLLFFTFNPVVYASSDTTPPKLINIHTDKASYTVGDTLTVFMQIEDKESGLNADICCVCIRSSDGSHDDINIYHFKAGSEPDTYTAQLALTKDTMPSGTYTAQYVALLDNSGNGANYWINEYPDGSQPEFSFTNNARTDWTGPVLTSFEISPSEVRVGQNVTAILTAQDDSGLANHAWLRMQDNVGNIFEINLERNPSGSNRYYGTTYSPLPAALPSGDYYPFYIFLYDSLGNNSAYTSATSFGTGIVYTPIPDEMKKKVTVINELDESEHPVILSIEIAPKTLKQGDPVDITLTLDTKRNLMQDVELTSYIDVNWSSETRIHYQKVSDGIYRAHAVMPVGMPVGEYMFWCVQLTRQTNGIYLNYNLHGADWKEDQIDQLFPQTFTITPVFSGTDNISIRKGSSFDPLAGVGAANEAEGDMTSKITAEAPAGFNTDTVGMYLFKYKIQSKYTDLYGKTLYYYDFRWVGVTETEPADTGTGDTPLVVSDGSVAIGATSAEASILKNGNDVSYASSMSGEGSYTISTKDNYGLGTKSRAGFVIDQSGPSITASQTEVSTEKVKVQVSATDRSGIAETKWGFGARTVEDIKTSGTAFSGEFMAEKYGKYTIYAKDIPGNESIKVIDVSCIPVTKMTLNRTSTSIISGYSEKFTASVLPQNASYRKVTWASSNPNIAAVDQDGNVTGVGAGTARITARTADASRSVTCDVTVTSPVPVSDVKLNKTSLTLIVSQSYRLLAAVYPSTATNKSVTWSSSDPGIASVDQDGNVRAVSAGSAKITATALDGSKTKTCSVKVNEPIAVTKVQPSRLSLALLIGSSYRLKAKVYPSNAFNKTITWASGDNSIATVDANGFVRAVGLGSTTITAMASNGKMALCTLTVKPVPVSRVRLNKASLSLAINGRYQLVAAISPSNATDKTITWYSNDTSIVSVDDFGNMVALNKGTTYIYARASNGKYARCKVTVK